MGGTKAKAKAKAKARASASSPPRRPCCSRTRKGTPALRAIARLLCAALASDAESLWTPLLTRGWGSAAAEVGVTPRDREDETEGRGAADALGGRREGGREGQAREARAERRRGARGGGRSCGELEGDEDPPHLTLRETLQADAEWQACAGGEGRGAGRAGRRAERDAVRAEADQADDDGAAAAAAAAAAAGGGGISLAGMQNMMSGRDLLQVLQSLSMRRQQ